jgi:hypothetical protein
MDSLPLAGIILISFFMIFAVHQISRVVIGENADTYPSGILIAGGIFYAATNDISSGIAASLSATTGHYLSVFLCKRFHWHEKNRP